MISVDIHLEVHARERAADRGHFLAGGVRERRGRLEDPDVALPNTSDVDLARQVKDLPCVFPVTGVALLLSLLR
jgi:hypothetical protein